MIDLDITTYRREECVLVHAMTDLGRTWLRCAIMMPQDAAIVRVSREGVIEIADAARKDGLEVEA